MILDDIVYDKKLQLIEDKKVLSLEQIKAELKTLNLKKRDFKKALKKENISIIAEIKKASPSKGVIREDFNPLDIGEIYEKIDIDAVSILTEKKYFLGKNEYINEVKKINSKPILRKDFIIDEYQLYEAKLIGADAVLLIAAVLKDKLRYFYNKTLELGLDAITEVHNEEEAKIAGELGCSIIGINNRDLRDFSTDIKNTEKLMKYIPKDITIVSESSIKTPEDILYLKSIGVDAVLIGETFMRNIDSLSYINDFLKKAKRNG
ncbi:indole-3-glycerol phosphate synthase TrpC [Clostridium felsineum]|uniref:indole-3-glycerol phosphate synthase TrpC n=1 Tax=Clostridium felsineum TaxID=36839 RepID=UPI00098BDBAF|nr:indole-3-glycerol phosphate synthase TrpC [Clostridium felsineum]URZ14750.1 Indole-3-glycerol phosphate synthase [Clostridium felsineum DSM 794]